MSLEALSGLFSAGGSVASAMMSARQAKKNRKFQERMARHAHRYEMEDLRKAGLNPILTGKYGGSATPSGAMASIPDFGSAASTAVSAFGKKTEAKAQKKQAEMVDEQIAQMGKQTELIGKQIEKLDAEITALGRDEPFGIVGQEAGQALLDILNWLRGDGSPPGGGQGSSAQTPGGAIQKAVEKLPRLESGSSGKAVRPERRLLEAAGKGLEKILTEGAPKSRPEAFWNSLSHAEKRQWPKWSKAKRERKIREWKARRK